MTGRRDQRGDAASRPRPRDAGVVFLIDGKPYVGWVSTGYVSPWTTGVGDVPCKLHAILEDGTIVSTWLS